MFSLILWETERLGSPKTGCCNKIYWIFSYHMYVTVCTRKTIPEKAIIISV